LVEEKFAVLGAEAIDHSSGFFGDEDAVGHEGKEGLLF